MQLGVVFPQAEISADAGAVREFAEATQELGYEHLIIYDHVLGADVSQRPEWMGPYTSESLFHEVFVVFGYIAAVAPKLELATAILVLPQRQTALVAKQAAELDILTNGRFRLGVGLGWNDVEYEALGMNFHDRGRRSEEQVEVLRRLWTENSVTYHGRWHTIDAAGINPLPIQRPIPVWFGGYVEPALRRAARIGDGVFVQSRDLDAAAQTIGDVRRWAEEAGRDPAALAFDMRITVTQGTPDDWRAQLARWRTLDVGYITVNTLGAGLALEDRIDLLRRAGDALRAS
jgi:probable F420-dependent oxidoreductase